MKASLQRFLLLGLGGVWCVLILMRILMTEAPQEVPLQFVTGQPAAKTRAAVGGPDPWHVKRVTTQAREMPEGPKKNMFAPLGESTAVVATTVTAKRAKYAPPPLPVVAAAPLPAPPPLVVAAPPPAPPGPTPEEWAAQAVRQQAELNLKQVREQMGQYRYVGYLSQHGVPTAFIGKGKDIYILRTGDTLDGKFLVASIDPTTVKLREPSTSLEASIELKKDSAPGPS